MAAQRRFRLVLALVLQFRAKVPSGLPNSTFYWWDWARQTPTRRPQRFLPKCSDSLGVILGARTRPLLARDLDIL